MVPIVQDLVSASKYSIKCPNTMKPQGITIHNTANNASAKNEITYMKNNNNQVSYHYAVDDIEIRQGIPENRNAWHAGDGNGKGNMTTIAIEICYSTGDKKKFEKAQENAAEFTAKKLKEYGWDTSKVYPHKHWSGKHCPHRTLDEYGWDYFINLVKKYMNAGQAATAKPASGILYRVRKTWKDTGSQIGAYNSLENAKAACKVGYSVFDANGKAVYINSGSKPAPTPVAKKAPNVTYRIWDDVKNTWLSRVTNNSDYAGIYGHDVCAVQAKLSSGNIYYKVHTKGGKWLPEVKNENDYAGIFNKPIDGIMFKTDTGFKVYYQVHIRSTNKWLPYVTGYNEKDNNNGYAGILGKEIDGIRMYVK